MKVPPPVLSYVGIFQFHCSLVNQQCATLLQVKNLREGIMDEIKQKTRDHTDHGFSMKVTASTVRR
ncbi:MAG: hypothetical protein IID17_03920 [Nitrospinae bacterium]|nr:hypothetical protein [Nitrospinota bacterium]